MRTKIISAFPGTGKSYFKKDYTNSDLVEDLDSNDFTDGYDSNGKVLNPDFPDNYITAIKKKRGTVEILLISCQDEVISKLIKEKFKVTLVYPERALREEYKKRFENRGSTTEFISLLIKNWDGFLDQIERQDRCDHIVLRSNQYISDIIKVT